MPAQIRPPILRFAPAPRRAGTKALASTVLAALAGAAQAGPAPVAPGDATQLPPPTALAASAADTALRTAFRRADANHDARISHEEAAFLPAVAEQFARIDRNGDDALSLDEFESGLAVPAR